jgi:outer membrane protein assembly factor BamB
VAKVVRLLGVLAGVAVLAAGCQWPMVRFGAERTGYSPLETTVSAGNVGQLTEQWTASLIGPGSDPVVAGGHVFVTAAETSVPPGSTSPGSDLYSFDAKGRTDCSSATSSTPSSSRSPKACTPVWSVPFAVQCIYFPGGLSAPAVSSGDVWIETKQSNDLCDTDSGTMNAYDETTGSQVAIGGQGGTTVSPIVANGIVYADWQIQIPTSGPFGALEGLDAATGVPLFTTVKGEGTAPTVAHGMLYSASIGGTKNKLYAFDAAGTTGCAPAQSKPFGFPTECRPVWTARLPASPCCNTVPAVANGYVYIGGSTGSTPTSTGILSAVPAGGCGASRCAPAWTAQTGGAIESSVAVTPKTVFVGSDDGKLYAFPAHGCGAKICQPLWTATTGGAVKSSPSVAGDVVYVGSDDGNLYAFDAHGCGQTTCTPAWSANVGAPIETSPAVSNGRVFVTDTAGTLHAYGLHAANGS